MNLNGIGLDTLLVKMLDELKRVDHLAVIRTIVAGLSLIVQLLVLCHLMGYL